MQLSTDSLQQTGQSILTGIPVALQLYSDLRAVWQRKFQSGLYEILEYESVLELGEPQGESARFRKRLRVKFLQDHVIAFQDYAWGDGEALLNYRCSPGMVVDRYREGTRWNVLISLRETKQAGDVEEFHIERTLRGSFVASEAWWETSLEHKTHRLKVSVIFPKKRPPHTVVLLERNKKRTTSLDSNSISNLPDGRQLLTWETDEVKRFETYSIKWQW